GGPDAPVPPAARNRLPAHRRRRRCAQPAAGLDRPRLHGAARQPWRRPDPRAARRRRRRRPGAGRQRGPSAAAEVAQAPVIAFLDQWIWYVLLLPLAAISGWVIGRRGGERHSDSQVSKLSTTYFRGLNYLLNEQPDKAIELFLHIAELDKDTFETQVALGHLFRRRGEVDRAIRLHQALVQRPDLSDQQKVQALLALGEDYMKSGLLDRAETVFTDLARIDQRAPQALRHLIAIYQAERDWAKAIENATRYEAVTGEPRGKLVAPVECELADRHRAAGEVEAARAAIARAYAADSTSVRAGMLEGRIEVEAGNDRAAIRAFERAARHDPDYLPELLPALLASYARTGD